jgi:hypothetical protein
MKIHSGWLATALLIFVVLGCNLSKNSNNSNNSNKTSNDNKATPQPTRRANADVFVDKIYMAKDVNGKAAADETDSFAPDDRKIHCVIRLNKAKKGTKVRFIWKPVDVPGLSNEDSKTIDYTTNSFENSVNSHLSQAEDWRKGKYRVDVYINDAFDKTIEFTIE